MARQEHPAHQEGQLRSAQRLLQQPYPLACQQDSFLKCPWQGLLMAR
jgi:hypothetical protein